MARQLRIEFENAIYHVCARGNARQPIFLSDADRSRLIELLRCSARRFDVEIIAFVLMGNHFHLIVQTRRPKSEPDWRLVVGCIGYSLPTRCFSTSATGAAVISFKGDIKVFWSRKANIC